MQFNMKAMLLAVAVSSASAFVVGSKPAVINVPKNFTSASTAKNITAADVTKLHHKLENIAIALQSMLAPNHHGSLAETKVAPALRTFVAELRATLKATDSPTDIHAAMRRLRSAEGGMLVLTKALNSQQESLMRQDATEEMNLLLGVLMVRRKEPMAKQLEVLASPEFRGLPVSKALTLKHDSKTPLFQQVATYMDAHGANSTDAPADKAQKLAKTQVFFEERADKLEHEDQVMEQMHKRRVHELEKLIKKSSKATAHRLQMEKKHLEREYKKHSLMHKQETKTMRDVVSAIKRGDAAALKRAQAALQAHLQAMKAQTGGFLYLLQLGHRLAERDCPFCVAQCIGKCHDTGSPYAQCMTQCADAGQ